MKKLQNVMQQGIMYRVDNLTVTEQRELTEYLPDSIHTLSHRYYEEQYSATIESLQSLTYVVTFVMIIVLCIALGNLTSILYGNRMDELKILHSIGITKEKIVHKLWLENSLVCIGGYWIVNTFLNNFFKGIFFKFCWC